MEFNSFELDGINLVSGPLRRLARPKRTSCMNCGKKPRVAVHWANGHGMAWFCIPDFMKWAEEDDRDIVGVWYLEDGEMPSPTSEIKKTPKGTDKVRKLGEKISLKEIHKRLTQRHMGPGPHPSGSPQAVHGKERGGGWWQDNPRARGRDWTPGPNTMTAGYTEARVDPKEIAKLPGARGEEKRIDWDRVRALAESIKAEGLRYKPLIIVEQDRTAYIWEGNHRVRAAIEAGLESIIVEIRYFGGSEELEGIWKPELVTRHYGPGPHPSGSPQSAHSGKVPYQKIKFRLGEGKTRIAWVKSGRITKSFGVAGLMFSVVDKYGEFKNELIVATPGDIIWQKPARMNLKYAELEIVERHYVPGQHPSESEKSADGAVERAIDKFMGLLEQLLK